MATITRHWPGFCKQVFSFTITITAAVPRHGSIIFDTLEQSSFQKYTTCWVFLALRHMLYLCICVFVFVYLCMRHLVISVLISHTGELQRRVEPVRQRAAGRYQIGDGKQLCSENARRRAFSDPGLRLDWRVQISRRCSENSLKVVSNTHDL